MKEIFSLIERTRRYLKSAEEILESGKKFVEIIVQCLKEKGAL